MIFDILCCCIRVLVILPFLHYSNLNTNSTSEIPKPHLLAYISEIMIYSLHITNWFFIFK